MNTLEFLMREKSLFILNLVLFWYILYKYLRDSINLQKNFFNAIFIV